MQGDREVFERGPAVDLWRHTLSQIPTLFGRLVYLSSLRDANTGKYEHHGLEMIHGDEESDRVLRESHCGAFLQWLTYSIEAQKADLDLYFSTLDGPRRTVVEAWSRLVPYRNFLPASARDVERQLFFADLETLLALLRNEYGVAATDPDA